MQTTPSGGEYDLGIDLGTTWTAAATREVGGPADGDVRVVPLEARSVRVPSVVLVDLDGGLMVGSAAEDAAPRAPERVVREFKRRLGDEEPIVVAGGCFSADGIAAEMVRWVADRVARGRGAPPRRVAVSHPAGWGADRRGGFAEALTQVGLPDAVLLPEPEAAAIAHAAAGRIPAGHTTAVYDLGGGTFDAAVVRGSPAGRVTVLGRGQGLEALGGVDFDEALFWHVCGELAGAVAALDPADPDTTRAVTGLRRACVAAKEALSADTEAVVAVELPGTRTRVRVTRSELEEMISPALHQTVDVLSEVLDTAGVRPEQLDSVLLVGGSSRIPVVSQVLSRALGRPVAVDPDPTTAVARGAAVAAGGDAAPELPGLAAPPTPAAPPGSGSSSGALATEVSTQAAVPAPRVLRPLSVAPAPRRHPVSGPLPATTAATGRVGALAAPRPDAEVDSDASTVQLARSGGTGTAAPPPCPPVGAVDAAPAVPAPLRRRLVASAVGGGVLLAAAGVVAATVPMITTAPAGQSATVPLPAPVVAPPAAAPGAPAAPPITSDVSTVADTGTTAPTRSSGGAPGPAAPATARAPRPAAPPAAAPLRPVPVKPPAAKPAPEPKPDPKPDPPKPDPPKPDPPKPDPPKPDPPKPDPPKPDPPKPDPGDLFPG